MSHGWAVRKDENRDEALDWLSNRSLLLPSFLISDPLHFNLNTIDQCGCDRFSNSNRVLKYIWMASQDERPESQWLWLFLLQFLDYFLITSINMLLPSFFTIDCPCNPYESNYYSTLSIVWLFNKYFSFIKSTYAYLFFPYNINEKEVGLVKHK